MNRPARSRSTFPRRAPRGLDIEGQALWVVGEPLAPPRLELVQKWLRFLFCMVPKDFGGPNGFLRDAQGFWGCQRFYYYVIVTAARAQCFCLPSTPARFALSFDRLRPAKECAAASLFGRRPRPALIQKMPRLYRSCLCFCLVLWPIDREPRAPSRKVPQAAEYHKPSRRVPIVGPRFLKVPTVFSEMPNVFEGANVLLRDTQGFLKVPTVLLLRYRYCCRSPVFVVFRLHQYVIVWTAVCVHVQAVCNHNKDLQI